MNGWCPEKWNLKQQEAEQRKSIKKSYFQQEKRYWKVGIRLFVEEKLTERTTILRDTTKKMSSGVGFFCFYALEDTKQKKPTPLDRGPPLHVNRV